MKTNQLFEKLWEHGRTLKRVGLVLVMCLMAISQMWADDRQHYVGVALENPNNYTVKLNVNRATWGWYQYGTSKAGVTFEGKKVYIANYQTKSDDNYIWDFQWQLYDGATQKYSKNLVTNTKSENYYDYYVYNYDGNEWYSKQVMNDSRTYFDATGWTGTDIRLVITHAQLQKYHTMYPVTGTKLYYTNDLSYWDNAMGVGVVSGGSSSRAGDQTAYYEYLTDISSQATEYTGLKHYSFNNNDEEKCYLIVNDGKAGEQPTITYEGTNYLTLLNKTQTINSVVREHDGYVSGNAKQQINISSYELTSQGSTTQRTPNMSTSESSETVSACRTATTTFSTSGAIASHYQFDGFWTDATSGSRLDNDVAGTYTYYPTAATTVYARFSRIRYTLTYYANGGTGSVPSTETIYSGETVTVKDNTGLLKKEGKVFAGWATSAARANQGTIDYAPGATFTAAANVDLYAVWTNGSYLFSVVGSGSNGTLNETDFITRGTDGVTNNSAQAVNGVTFSQSYYKTSGNQTSNLAGGSVGLDGKVIVYDAKTTQDIVRIYVKNTHTSSAYIQYLVIKEGTSVTSTDTVKVTLTSGATKLINVDMTNTKGARLAIASNQYSKMYFTQIIAIEKGSTLPAPGASGYELASCGRLASASGSINGMAFSIGSTPKFGGTTKIKLSSTSNYFQFTTSASVQLQVKISANKHFYVCTDKSNAGTTGKSYGGTSGTKYNINLGPTGTYYLTGDDGDLTIDTIAFADYVACTAPSALAASDVTSGGVTLTVTDSENTNDYEFYVNTSSSAPGASATPTAIVTGGKSKAITGLTAGTTYYAWARSKCDYFNKSAWVALGSPGYFTTSAAATYDLTVAVSPAGYGTVSPTSVTGITTGTSTSSSLNTFTVDGTTVTATAADATSAWTYAFDSWSGLPATVTEDATVTAVFTRTGKSYTITLDKQVASNTPTGSVSATYGSAMPSIATLPSHANYTFGGFYTAVAGGGTQYYTNTGASAKNSDFTAATTLYAKFSQGVTLDDNGGTADGSSSVLYNATSATTPTAPTYAGHTVLGYYAESGCSNLVMSTAGALTNYSGWVSSGKWIHNGASTLYAKWKCNTPTITDNGNNTVTITVPNGTTVRYTIDGSDPSSSSGTVYSTTFDITADVTVKAIAYQSGSQYVDSEIASRDCDYTAPPCFTFSCSSQSDKIGAISSGGSITASLWDDATLTGGTMTNSSSESLNVNKTYGLVMESGKEVTVTLAAGSALKVGSVITLSAGVSDASGSQTSGLTVSGNTCSPASNTSSTAGDPFTQTYTVTALDGLAGTNTFTVEMKSDLTKTYLNGITVSNCDDCTPIPVKYISYSSTNIFAYGGTPSVAYVVNMSNPGGGTVTYSSSNTDVATVDSETGLVTAVSPGTTVITAAVPEADGYCAANITKTITVQALVTQEINVGAGSGDGVAWGTPPDMTFDESTIAILSMRKVANISNTGYTFDEDELSKIDRDGRYMTAKFTGSESSKNASKYLTMKFKNEYYRMRLTNVVVPIQPVSNNGKAVVEIYKNNTKVAESSEVTGITKGVITDVTFTLTTPYIVDVNTEIEVRIFFYGQTTGFRLASAILVNGSILRAKQFTGNGNWDDASNWEYHDMPETYHDVDVWCGASMTITGNKTAHDLKVKSGATLNVSTNSGTGITLTLNQLNLEGGLSTYATYDMPRVYIDPKSSIARTDKTINFDIAVDSRHYWPIALPFNVDIDDVDYANPTLKAASTYKTHYVVKRYDGERRARVGADRENNWVAVEQEADEILQAGYGYILTAVKAPAYTTDGGTIRFPMKNVADDWLTEGEQATVDAVTKNKVNVYAWNGVDENSAARKNVTHKGWNLVGVPYMSCFQTGNGSTTDMATDGAAILPGKMKVTGEWDEEDEIMYVSIPTSDFSEYIQKNIVETTTKLLPGWCFFIQLNTSGTLTFSTAHETNSTGIEYRAPKAQYTPIIKTGITLSSADASDNTSFLVSDRFSTDYEIGKDLEKMFGETGYTLATYSLVGGTKYAYNALSETDIQQVIPIGYRAPADGDYTFSINPIYAENGAFEHVYLIDYETNIITDLMSYSYTFSTERTQNDARFALNIVKRQDTTTDIENGVSDANDMRKVLISGQLYIILNGKMYDATGKAVK